jgi:exodeoxyribonuclease VII large subunit
MALETSPQSPAPVRQIANAIAGWVDRLGAVWWRADRPESAARPGQDTVFMTCGDSVADISVPLTCPATLFDGLDPPLVEGAGVVVHAKPSYYANRGTSRSTPARSGWSALGELLARLERRRQLLPAEGLFAGPS